MNELKDIGFSEKEIKNMIEINPMLLNLSTFEVSEHINFLRAINCTDGQLKNIIMTNPFYLNRSMNDLVNLISRLKMLQITNLNITFDSNPYMLNKDCFEIENFINGSLKNGFLMETIIDIIDAGMLEE